MQSGTRRFPSLGLFRSSKTASENDDVELLPSIPDLVLVLPSVGSASSSGRSASSASSKSTST